MVLSAGVNEDEYSGILSEITESNRRNVLGLGILAFFFLTAMTLLSFIAPGLAVNRWLYVAGFVTTGAIILLAHWKGKRSTKDATIITYAFIIILLIFGIMLGTLMGPDEITATYIALLLTVPQMFTDRPYRMYAVIFGSVACFIVMVLTQKSKTTWNSDIMNAIVFGCVSAVVSTYMTNVKVKRHCLEHTIRYMAETDQLTGLKNRNCFEQRMKTASILNGESLYCVYVDVNGLHELNNSEGHEAGDRMLQYIATVMQNIFGTENTFRVGGDEYVAIGGNCAHEELREMVVSLRQAVEAAGYHAAIGMKFEHQDGSRFQQIIKQAETNMYEDKRAYYEKTGAACRSR